MIANLLEHWLDNASERSYQHVFVQMLTAEGYTVLHSTRHCLLEFGKDVLAVAPDGIGCAFQLKGDPRGQMTIGEFRKEIQPQLVQLMSQPPAFPGFPSGPYRSYLVSNGSFSEEVQVAVALMNGGPYPSKLELWARGKLFDMALRASGTLWPSEVRDNRDLLDIYLADPTDQLPLAKLNDILSSVLGLDGDNKKHFAPRLRRALSSAAWATGLALARFAERENYQAVAAGWTLCRCLMEHAIQNAPFDASHFSDATCEITERAVLDALVALWEEVKGRDHLVVPPALEDVEIYAWRLTVVQGLLSALWLANQALSLFDIEEAAELREWLRRSPRAELWGEGAVGPVLSLALARMSADSHNDGTRELLASTLEAIISANQVNSPAALPSPYYSGEESLRILLSLGKEGADDETFGGASFMARPLFLALAALDQKQLCQLHWTEFSRLSHRLFQFDDQRDYFRLAASEGVEISKHYPERYGWEELIAEVGDLRQQPGTSMPDWLTALWWQVAPQRADARSVVGMFAAYSEAQRTDGPVMS